MLDCLQTCSLPLIMYMKYLSLFIKPDVVCFQYSWINLWHRCILLLVHTSSIIIEGKFISLIGVATGEVWHNKTQARAVDRGRSVERRRRSFGVVLTGILPRQIGSVFNEHDDSSVLHPQIYRRDTARLVALTRLSSFPPWFTRSTRNLKGPRTHVDGKKV